MKYITVTHSLILARSYTVGRIRLAYPTGSNLVSTEHQIRLSTHPNTNLSRASDSRGIRRRVLSSVLVMALCIPDTLDTDELATANPGQTCSLRPLSLRVRPGIVRY